MTTPYLLADLRRDEGLELTAYPDPISHGEPWTIGYGHTGPDVREGLQITLDQAETLLAGDAQAAQRGLDRTLPWWRTLSDPRQDVLVNMAFNMGVAKLLKFTETLAALKAQRYAGAALDMLDSDWARELPERSRRLSQQMLTGVRAQP